MTCVLAICIPMACPHAELPHVLRRAAARHGIAALFPWPM